MNTADRSKKPSQVYRRLTIFGFAQKNTQEYKDAIELYELYKSTKAKLTETDDRSSVESERKDKIILKVGKLVRCALCRYLNITLLYLVP